MRRHRFIREGDWWYADVPEFLEQGGSKRELAVVSGTDNLLDIIAGVKNEVTLEIDTDPFDTADELLLTELYDPVLGGGYYHMKKFENKRVNRNFWLCDVTRFVLGDIPERIYVKRVR